MHVQVAHYRLGRGGVGELREHVASGPARIMPEVPGFVGYYAFDAGDGVVASVSVFEDAGGTAEAERRLEGWVAEAMERFAIEPVSLSEGAVFAAAPG